VADEIERKFLVPTAPDQLGAGSRIEQGYLAVDGDVEVRVRRGESGDRLTVKAGSGLVRTEIDLPLDAGAAEALWPHSAGRQIRKVRHEVAVDGGWTAEVDVYDGDLRGLCVAEVEFPTTEDAAAFTPPSWFGEELTGRPGWSNADLASHGRPPA
jgi:CYTH domain-containing protein